MITNCGAGQQQRDPLAVHCLSHLTRISASVLRLVADSRCRRHFTVSLLREIASDPTQDPQYWTAANAMVDTVEMADELGWQGCPRKFVTLKRL